MCLSLFLIGEKERIYIYLGRKVTYKFQLILSLFFKKTAKFGIIKRISYMKYRYKKQ